MAQKPARKQTPTGGTRKPTGLADDFDAKQDSLMDRLGKKYLGTAKPATTKQIAKRVKK